MSITQAQCVIAAQVGFGYQMLVSANSGARGYDSSIPGNEIEPQTFFDEDTNISIIRATQNTAANSCQLTFRDDAFEFQQPGGSTVIRCVFEGFDDEFDCVWNGSTSYIVVAGQPLWTYLDSRVGDTIGVDLEIIA